MTSMSQYHFPRWSNKIRPLLAVVTLVGPVYLTGVVLYGASPETLNVGYAPEQPVPFSHKLHAGDLKMDCRYCHTTVEESAQASIPPTKTCMNCHDRIHTESPRLEKVRESAKTGQSIPWVRVHDLPDYAYFDHSAHVTKGVSCVECHGRVDQMDVVEQVAPLSMGWCLDCHRSPESHLRPVDEVTNMSWTSEIDREELGAKLRKVNNIHPRQDCSTCHR